MFVTSGRCFFELNKDGTQTTNSSELPELLHLKEKYSKVIEDPTNLPPSRGVFLS